MTGYTRRWECAICKEGQESIDYPSVEVCEDCVTPVARQLCRERLGVKMESEGVDSRYWMDEADGLLAPTMIAAVHDEALQGVGVSYDAPCPQCDYCPEPSGPEDHETWWWYLCKRWGQCPNDPDAFWTFSPTRLRNEVAWAKEATASQPIR